MTPSECFILNDSFINISRYEIPRLLAATYLIIETIFTKIQNEMNLAQFNCIARTFIQAAERDISTKHENLRQIEKS